MKIPPQLQLRKEPKQQRSQQLVQKILDAAVLIAKQEGLAAFNTNAVAAAAGVDVASIYQYFPNKESILYWATDRWLRRIRKACAAMDGPEFQDLSWREFFARYGEHVSAIPEYRSAFSLHTLRVLYPEYQPLGEAHLNFLVDFLARHCLRLGAKGDEASIRAMVKALCLAANSILEASLEADQAESEALNDCLAQIWLTMLGQLFADQ